MAHQQHVSQGPPSLDRRPPEHAWVPRAAVRRGGRRDGLRAQACWHPPQPSATGGRNVDVTSVTATSVVAFPPAPPSQLFLATHRPRFQPHSGARACIRYSRTADSVAVAGIPVCS